MIFRLFDPQIYFGCDRERNIFIGLKESLSPSDKNILSLQRN